jgi:putative membrane protein
MKTRHPFASLAAVSLVLAMPAFAADTAQDFVDKAAVGGKFEVDSSKIAQDKVTDQNVKEFAQKMIEDHNAANAKLQSIAGEQKLQLPVDLDAPHRSELQKLQHGKAPLDQPYVDMQRSAHADAVSLFESYAKDGDNGPLKVFAQETLPTLKMHKEMIEKIATTIGTDSSSAANSTTPAVKTTDTPSPSAPEPGANSFTEDQAKDRIEDAGYSNVSKLIKDDQGIWRGQASKDGKNIHIALDYQGNIVVGNN